jgi:hypothetical protein
LPADAVSFWLLLMKTKLSALALPWAITNESVNARVTMLPSLNPGWLTTAS